MASDSKSSNVSWLGLVQVLALGCGLCSVLALFSGWAYLLELSAHFRLQYLLLALGCALILGMYKQWRQTQLMLLIALLNLGVISPWYLPAPETEAGTVSLKVMHSNVNAQNTDYPAVMAAVTQADPDIFIAQEVTADWVQGLQPLAERYPYRHAVPQFDNFGMMVFSKLPLEAMCEFCWGGDSLLSVSFTIRRQGKSLQILAAHPLPPIGGELYRQRNQQLEALAGFAAQAKSPLLLIGDLNISMWSADYQQLEQRGLRNARQGFGVVPTWPTQLPILMIPIDHALVSDAIQVQDFQAGPDVGSDHLPIVLQLRW